jgi:parvulin-like peptidyl-prolyl isomerase
MKHSKDKYKKSRRPILIGFAVLVVIIAIAALVLNIDKMTKPSDKNVVATVNGEPITEADIQEVWLTLPENVKNASDKNAVRESIINQSIIEKAVIQEAVKSGISVSDPEVDDLITLVKQKSNMSDEQLNQMLKQQNINIDFLKKMYKKQLTVLKFINETQNSIVISDTEVEQFYSSNKQFFVDEKNVTAPLANVTDQIKYVLSQEKINAVIEGIMAKADIVRK